MKTRLVKILGAILVCFGAVGAMAAPAFAADDVFCENLTDADMRASMGCGTDENALPNTIINILDFVIGVGGLVAVIYVVIGGYSYMTSQGDSSKIQKAKSTILYAVIGLVICALAFVIVNFALTSLNETETAKVPLVEYGYWS